MAYFKAFRAVDMTDLIFLDDPDLALVNVADMAFGDGLGNVWRFDGDNIERDDDEGEQIPVGGTVDGSTFEIGGNAVFELFDIPNASAVEAWDRFQGLDEPGLFGLLLSGADSIVGSGGADKLFGFEGNDRMKGLGGSDTLRGGAEQDRLDGGGGRDQLEGGRGRDELTGGTGGDAFVFDTQPTHSTADTIVDFAPGVDEIVLDSAVFGALPPGPLGPGRFVSATNIGPGDSTAGIESNDRILYDRDSGSLYYDSNGSGAGHRVLIAVVLDGTGLPPQDLGAGDFRVI